MPQLRIHGGEVEPHLPREFRLEGLHLEVDHHVAAERQVVEQEVEEELLAADGEAVLSAHIRKAEPELHQELRDVAHEPPFELPLVRIR